MNFSRLLIVALVMAASAMAGSVTQSDWCLNINGVSGTANCNPFAFAAPADGSAFDTTFDPNTLGSIVITLGPGTHTVLFYGDYDLDSSSNGAFNEFATVLGAPGASEHYLVDDPSNGVFTNFSAATLGDVNNVSTFVPVGGCCDVSVAMGWVNYLVPANTKAIFTFRLTERDPGSGFRIRQEDGDSGTDIYFAQSVELRPTGHPGVPEPSQLLLVPAALGVLAMMRKRFTHAA